ncbi:DUF6507 family protein [Streptomyces sp. NPDC055897]
MCGGWVFVSGWDVSPSGVSGVLGRAATAAEGLSKAGEAMQVSLPSAAHAAGTISGPSCGPERMGPVGSALGEFLEKKARELGYIAARTGHSLTGALEATTAYVHGDLEMAANKERQALRDPVIDGTGKEVVDDTTPGGEHGGGQHGGGRHGGGR